MKKLMTAFLLLLVILCGCRKKEEGTSKPDIRPPEVTEIRLALPKSGHILNRIAEEQGFLRDEGITVTYVPVNTDFEVFDGLRIGRIDVASNSGTNLPLQMISSGLDLTIVGGYLLTGCMPIVARVETPWTSIEDLIGKTVAFEPNLYAVTGPLLDMGYDPLNDINWYETVDQADRLKAVKNGEADFALVGTTLNYAVISDPELKIVTYAADVLPEYSCCRVEARTEWVKENPNTVKALLRAWIRAMEYYESHHEEAVDLTVRLTGEDEDFVRAYLDNPRFNLNIGPMKSSVERAWDYMDRLGLLDESAKRIDIDDHINVILYKEALDECQELYGKEDPRFYERLQAQFAKHNM